MCGAMLVAIETCQGMSLRYDVILAKKIGVNGFKWIKSVFFFRPITDP